MRRILLALVISAVATASIFAASAAASGPAAPGKEVLELECSGLGSITVSVPKPEPSNGAGQAVGQKLHGIPVSFTFLITDVTKATTLVSEEERVGGGKAHQNQSTTECSATFVELPASIFFDEHELPPGVEGTDIIRASFVVQVVVKP
jgi:hypothetical protein